MTDNATLAVVDGAPYHIKEPGLRTLRELVRFYDENGFCPSVADIVLMCDFASKSSAKRWMDYLCDEGYAVQLAETARTLRPTMLGRQLLTAIA